MRLVVFYTIDPRADNHQIRVGVRSAVVDAVDEPVRIRSR
jgi:hypothetical protein